MTEQRLRIAIQKSGRLSDGSFELLKSCGLSVSRGRDKLYGRVQEMPIDILLLRDDDIPEFVADDACDIGIIGQNVFQEDVLNDNHDAPAEEVMRLDFAGFVHHPGSDARWDVCPPVDWRARLLLTRSSSLPTPPPPLLLRHVARSRTCTRCSRRTTRRRTR